MQSLKELETAIRTRAEALDNRIATLSTGALGLTVTFSEFFISESTKLIELLGLSWALLTVSILVHLVGSMLGLKYGAAELYFRKAAQEDNQEPSEEDIAEAFGKEFVLMRIFFKAIVSSFFGGILSFSIFAIVNLFP